MKQNIVLSLIISFCCYTISLKAQETVTIVPVVKSPAYTAAIPTNGANSLGPYMIRPNANGANIGTDFYFFPLSVVGNFTSGGGVVVPYPVQGLGFTSTQLKEVYVKRAIDEKFEDVKVNTLKLMTDSLDVISGRIILNDSSQMYKILTTKILADLQKKYELKPRIQK